MRTVRTKSTVVGLFVFGMLVVISRGADVTWEWPLQIGAVGDSVVRTDGELVEAVNLRHDQTGTIRNVNGVPFTTTAARDGLVTTANATRDSVFTDLGTGTNFETILDAFGYLNPEATLMLDGLTPGRRYLAQLFVSDDRFVSGWQRGLTVTGGAHTAGPYSQGSSFALSGTFVADHSTQAIRLQGWNNVNMTNTHAAVLNAFQVRDLGREGFVLKVSGGKSGPTGPNVILVMTDDQGYGDLACHGNSLIQTPHLDSLHGQSLRFTAFHVGSTCSPTRAALMSGRHEFRVAVTHTYEERERMDVTAVTVAQVLRQAGFTTGIFGKWHLGDEKPFQPHRRGFDETFIHGGGGIGQEWDNSCGDVPTNQVNRYFDPVIRHNTTFVRTEGFCTDIFFTQALRWIKANRHRRFFAYLSTNAPHSPFICPDSYRQPYLDAGLTQDQAGFYGMITNIDDNMGRLLAKLAEWDLAENTLVIFMTDNGSAMGSPLYNAGMRGRKASPYEGGTRVPAFFRWPGHIAAGDCDRLAADVDIMPTLVELCGGKMPVGLRIDGRSLAPLLQDVPAEWPDRNLFVHVGRWGFGKAAQSKYSECAVRTPRFRLVNNAELYDIPADPGETTNVISQYPDEVAAMRTAYNQWWDEVLPTMINEEVPAADHVPYAVLYEQQRSTTGIPDWPTDEP